jgi:hypothetical protein
VNSQHATKKSTPTMMYATSNTAIHLKRNGFHARPDECGANPKFCTGKVAECENGSSDCPICMGVTTHYDAGDGIKKS